MCQQLAYLGVQRFLLVDHDVVEESNLNRLVGAGPDDVGRHKTEIAERLIRFVQADAVVDLYTKKLPDEEVWAALGGCDLLVGCFDNDYPRLLTTDFASGAGIPYIDAATDVNIDEEQLIYGGQVVAAGTSAGCLSCLGFLNQNEIRRAQLSDEQLENEAKIYGVPVESLRGSGPSVIPLNGVVASLAVMEAMALITGLRDVVKVQTYLGSWGRITRRDEPSKSCYYCNRWLAER